jgi:FKBP-type peptidyl-prolyl cis-trans isomerase SlyD
MRVTKDKVVTIEYTMTANEGRVVDTTDNGEPLSFIQGRGQLLPAIEEAIDGCAVGHRLAITLTPEQAYGERDERLVRKVPRDHVDLPGELHVGVKLKRKNGSKIIPIIVVAFDEETVTLDANSPLAGIPLNIDLVIVEVRSAVDAELKSGNVQSMQELYEKQAVDGVAVEFHV